MTIMVRPTRCAGLSMVGAEAAIPRNRDGRWNARYLNGNFPEPDGLDHRIGAAKRVELALGVLDMLRHRRRRDRQDLADLLVGFSDRDPLHDLAFARGQRRVLDLLALRLQRGTLERMMAVDGDDLEGGTCPRREIGLKAARAEAGHRA